MQDLPKSAKRRLRELARLAHERELGRELEALAAKVDAWRAGQISAFDLDEAIYRYDRGVARELEKRYNNHHYLHLSVAWALTEGLLSDDEVAAVRPHLAGALAFYKEQGADT